MDADEGFEYMLLKRGMKTWYVPVSSYDFELLRHLAYEATNCNLRVFCDLRVPHELALPMDLTAFILQMMAA